ncbi:PREDICTED: bifunctional protein FolD-like isoform X2 [Nicrophorus vespilloides]|uniref:Bifunctional protein FolD-like isoform X2 n=1 Tax=Nicrophorus vespilloides TaxID=110193 RepID=A0ABM1MAE4_NICVS|nr:PREDICTED: bifunctional protein FolD-like isoform X2 [Nicrophorus vespilloides]
MEKKSNDQLMVTRYFMNYLANMKVIYVGEDPGCCKFDDNIHKICLRIGTNSQVLNFPASVSQEFIIDKITAFNNDDQVDFILVLRDLPKHIDYRTVSDRIRHNRRVLSSDYSNNSTFGKLFRPPIKLMLQY